MAFQLSGGSLWELFLYLLHGWLCSWYDRGTGLLCGVLLWPVFCGFAGEGTAWSAYPGYGNTSWCGYDGHAWIYDNMQRDSNLR